MDAPRRVLVAVSAGIAAYKVPELVREFVRAGDRVRCIATPDAARFVSPMVLEALSGAPVGLHLFSAGVATSSAGVASSGVPWDVAWNVAWNKGESPGAVRGAGDREPLRGGIDHIELADWAEVVVVAPATADVLARMAAGMTNDLVTAVLLATRAPILVAPAMNVNMWEHPATQANLQLLRARGIRTVGPDEGDLACGWQGAGRMSEPAAIAGATRLVLGSDALAGETVLVTAGGTSEPIDTVRSLSNRSSGRMGFAVAAVAAARGAEVVLIAGPCALTTPAGVRRLDVVTAIEMRDAVFAELPRATVVIKAAAVADFRPARAETRKIKKEDLGEGVGLTLELVANPDILAEVCKSKGDRVVVGFAAESHDVVEAAKRKIIRKGCDLLVANDVSRADAGFDVDTNAVCFIDPDGGVEELPLLTKVEVAGQLLDRVAKLRASKA